MTGRVKVLGYRLAAVVADVSGITKIYITMNSQMNEADLEKIGLVSQ